MGTIHLSPLPLPPKAAPQPAIEAAEPDIFFYISQFICNLYRYIQIHSANGVLGGEGG
jgi:hypothetical protein